ncbi:MAG: creatininase family protein [Victivallales bacterium]|nr:creatininase family protein [Victivallales bacterium]
MRNLHKYEELFPDEFAAELKRRPLVYCTFGPLEYHGPHGALGMDPVKGYEICLRAAEISGGIVFPIIPFAPSVKTDKNGFVFNDFAHRADIRAMAKTLFPSIYTSIEVCEALYYELFENFAEDIGFKVCVVMGSHGPAGALTEKIVRKTPVFKGMKIIGAGSLSHNRDLVVKEYAKRGIPHISHGGMWEASMYMTVNPELVDPQKIKTAVPGLYEQYIFEKYERHAVPDYEEINQVSAEFGEELVRTSAERIAAAAMDALAKQGYAEKQDNNQ